MSTPPLGDVSPALNFAINNPAAVVVVNIYTPEGVLIGTERLSTTCINSLRLMEDGNKRYEMQLMAGRTRWNRHKHGDIMSQAIAISPSYGDLSRPSS